MDPIEGICGISEIVSGHVPAHSEIHGHTPEVQVCSQPTSPNIVDAQCPEELQDVKLVDRIDIPEVPRLIARQGPRILPFEEKPEGAITPQSYTRSGSEEQLGIRSPAPNDLISSPGMAVNSNRVRFSKPRSIQSGKCIAVLT